MAFSKSGGSATNFQIINETDSIIHGSGDYHESEGARKRGFESDSDGEKGTTGSQIPGAALKPGKKTRGRVKIEMKFIENKLRRYTTFSKRKTGIMKKVITIENWDVLFSAAAACGKHLPWALRVGRGSKSRRSCKIH